MSYIDRVYYILKRHLGFSFAEIESLDAGFAGRLINMWAVENDNNDIRDLQLHGFDPEKIPYYAKMMRQETVKEKRKVKLDKKDAEFLKNFTEKVLKNGAH